MDYFPFVSLSMVSPSVACGFQVCGFNQPCLDQKYSEEKKILESPKVQMLNLLGASKYLHSIYTVSGIISNLGMI